jgi:hypothetical protein
MQLTHVEQEVEIVFGHDLADPAGTSIPATHLQIAPGFWTLQRSAGLTFAAEVCVSGDALLRTPSAEHRVVFLGRGTAGQQWTERATRAEQNRYCTDVDQRSDLMLVETSVGTGLDEGPIPARMLTLRLFPNPARGAAEVEYEVGLDGPIRIELFDLLGRSVGVLHEGWSPAGSHRAPLAFDGLPGGTYVVIISSPEARAVQPIVLMR